MASWPAACPPRRGTVALIRVLLADDNAGVLAYLRVRLGKVFEIVGAFEDGKQAVDGVLRLDPDVMILDISMPVLNGFQAAARLRDAKCRTRVVVLTTYEESEFISQAFSSGACGGRKITKKFALCLPIAIRSRGWNGADSLRPAKVATSSPSCGV